MDFFTMDDISLKNKKVAIRLDLNVPIKEGVIKSKKRIHAVLPTIKKALDANAAIILLSHLGRPEEGKFEEKFSLKLVAQSLTEELGIPVAFHAYDPDLNVTVQPGEVVLMENVRFLVGEKKNNPELAQKFANLGDVYVMDAFGAAHRANASTEGAIHLAKEACAGPLMQAEILAATKLLNNPKRPLFAIVGGSKVSTKVTVLENLFKLVDGLILGGGIANTFLLAAGHNVGKSLVEEDFVEEAKRLMQKAKNYDLYLPLPIDVVVAKDINSGENARTCLVSEIQSDEAIFDVGPASIKEYAHALTKAASIVWNGPVGAYEFVGFDSGTKRLAEVLSESTAYTLICGGDCVAAIEKFGLASKMDYLSTGGGAFLEILEGKKLPALKALMSRV